MAKRTKKLLDNQELDSGIRINKYLSDAGICSRREADKHIQEGKVTINGVTAVMGSKVLPGDKVMFNGTPVKTDESLVLIAFNKPRGIVCTTDRREKDNIIDYINYGKRIYPIGRLDKDSEGLILLTNDGNIVNKILRAGNNHEKEYIVTVNKPITKDFIKGMSSGVPILDTVTRSCTVKAIDKFTFRIILTQGLNRQIRRMCEYFGYKVLTLQRIRIMNIHLGHLQEGGYRNVTTKELAVLNELIRNSVNTPGPVQDSMEDASDDEYDNISVGNQAVKISKTNKKEKENRNSKSGQKGKAVNGKTTNGESNTGKSPNSKTSNGKTTIGKANTSKTDTSKIANSKNGKVKYGKLKS